jgi:Holliday junction resolvase RusA-like endonuclease
MPATYTEWKENVASIIRYKGKNLRGHVMVGCVFYQDHVLLEVMETTRQRHGRADIDNLIGGVMDAMQMSGVIENDKDVVYIEGMFGLEK